MGISSKLHFLHILIQLPSLITITICQPDFRSYYCGTNGNYTTNSTYKSNLNTLFSSISSNTQINYGFYNFSVGQNTVNTINAIALCRGDLTVDDCHDCLNNATVKLVQVCPAQKEAAGWYEECMLRYSNRFIFGLLDPERTMIFWNWKNVTDPDEFNQELPDLLGSLQTQAAMGDTRLKFASGDKMIGFRRIYALMQCTPDLSEQDCSNCLGDYSGMLPTYCKDKQGGNIFGLSCNVRYKSYLFYNMPSSESPPPLPLSPSLPLPSTNSSSIASGKGSKRGPLIILIVTLIIVCIALVTLVFYCFFFRRRREEVESSLSIHEKKNDIETIESLQFDFGKIRVATNNFSDSNELGRGGFGAVYKGILLDGREIAVKRLAQNSVQGELEFKNEVLLVAKLQHRNLARLLGFCVKREERLLIYEFVPNTSLDHFLFDLIKRGYLDWLTRYKIITGIARGLLYLHEDSQLRVIHRDLKASNILLDAEMNPKIADFGIARIFEVDQTQGDTNRIVGTFGYMAPEYALHGLFSVKSDVYSFGVLVLEIITGKRSFGLRQGENSEDLISFVWRNWREGTAMNIIDETITANSSNQIMKCIHIGLLCVQEDAIDRPTMSSVVVMLSSNSLTLPLPSHPAYTTRRTLSEQQSSQGIKFDVS